jgi:selenide,water dikinase
MGGRVVLALNISAFPDTLPTEAIAAILTSAAAVVREAGGSVAGGHTIRSAEPIFGLAVQGVVHPDRILTKGGARAGDALVLSKPIGTGIVLAGGSPEDRRATIAVMRQLNRAASEALLALGSATHAVTDVTGFGLAGHGWEVAERSGVALHVEVDRVPRYPGATSAAQRGIRTGGDSRNREHLAGRVVSRVPVALDALCFDPQTSGGLLAAIDPAVTAAAEAGGFTVIGRVEPGPPRVVID